MDMRESILRYFEACLIVEEKEWVTDQYYYYITKGFTPKAWVHFGFNSGYGGYVSVDASFKFEEATDTEKNGMMAYYKNEADMLHLKRSLRELAKLV